MVVACGTLFQPAMIISIGKPYETIKLGPPFLEPRRVQEPSDQGIRRDTDASGIFVSHRRGLNIGCTDPSAVMVNHAD